jgi:hypothetical protein
MQNQEYFMPAFVTEMLVCHVPVITEMTVCNRLHKSKLDVAVSYLVCVHICLLAFTAQFSAWT